MLSLQGWIRERIKMYGHGHWEFEKSYTAEDERPHWPFCYPFLWFLFSIIDSYYLLRKFDPIPGNCTMRSRRPYILVSLDPVDGRHFSFLSCNRRWVADKLLDWNVDPTATMSRWVHLLSKEANIFFSQNCGQRGKERMGSYGHSKKKPNQVFIVQMFTSSWFEVTLTGERKWLTIHFNRLGVNTVE